jgi:glycosyltransferase 2 family protein
MTETGEGEGKASPDPLRAGKRRTLVSLLFLALVLAGAVAAVVRDRQSFADAMDKIGPGALALSLLFGLVGVGAVFPVWREVLGGLGARLPWAYGSRVLFVSQLGKYVPGSVWPVLMQMEAGRSRGVNRRTMIAGNLLTITLNCCVGIALACALLPFYDSDAISRYWWALLVLPALLLLLHPRAMPLLLDRAFLVIGRAPVLDRLDPAAELRAVAWAMVSWVALGLQLGVLAAAVTRGRPSLFVLCTAAAAFAIPLGVLFVPAPAGAGIREVILLLVLGTALKSGQALAVVLASRAVLIVCDLALAFGAAVFIRARHPNTPMRLW